MNRPLTKAVLRTALGVTDAGIAEFFEITRAAVAQWPEDLPIPELRRLQLESRRPDLIEALERGDFDQAPGHE